MFRAPIVHYATRHANRGQQAFLYEFSWPLAFPAEGLPHAVDVPFVFGTTSHPHIAAKIGNELEATALSEQVMDAWANFIKTGSPTSDDAVWRPFTDQERGMMTFGENRQLGQCRTMDRQEQLRIWPAFFGLAGPSSN